MINRVIPCLLIKDDVLVKTYKFKTNKYVGDPINTIKIFNEKEVDEIIVLDISSSKNNKEPNFQLIKQLTSECFMPICYGGGIRTIEHANRLFDLGVEKISMQSIVSWLKANPSKSQKVMNLNPSFVYFKVLHQDSPNGAQGLPLTPRISMAVDREYIPLGSLLYLSTYTPRLDKLDKGKIIRGKRLNKFMVAQDTGGAIKGSVRGDVFWGMGDTAEFLAGHMNSKGKYWLLIPKGVKL